MVKKLNSSDTIVIVKVELDDISEKYARNITADSLSRSLGETYYSQAVCKTDANNKLQRTAKRRR